MTTRIATLLALFVTSTSALAVDGLVTLTSPHPVAVTVDRLEQRLGAAGFRIFARVDHGGGARSVDMALRPTQLLIFGKPEAGTLLMQSSQTVGIELPLKYLVWEDAQGAVTIGWNDPDWLTRRHGIAERAKVVGNIQGALKKFATEAAQP